MVYMWVIGQPVENGSLFPLSPWTKSISTHIFAGIMCRCESVSHMPQDSLLCHSLKAFLGFGNRISHSVLDSYTCRLAHKPQRSACPVTMHNYSIWFSKLTSGPYACLESTLLSWISRTMPPSLFWFFESGSHEFQIGMIILHSQRKTLNSWSPVFHLPRAGTVLPHSASKKEFKMKIKLCRAHHQRGRNS